MVKVKCLNCWEVGYSASPKFVLCQCGAHVYEVLEGGQESIMTINDDRLSQIIQDGICLIMDPRM